MTAVTALAIAGGSLPHSEESERAVLAAILLDSECHLPPTAGRLRADDFYLGRHQRLFQAMLGLQEEGVEIDLRTLQARLEQQDILGPARDGADIEGIINVVHLILVGLDDGDIVIFFAQEPGELKSNASAAGYKYVHGLVIQ